MYITKYYFGKCHKNFKIITNTNTDQDKSANNKQKTGRVKIKQKQETATNDNWYTDRSNLKSW